MTEKEQQPVTPEIPTEAAAKPGGGNPPKNGRKLFFKSANRVESVFTY